MKQKRYWLTGGLITVILAFVLLLSANFIVFFGARNCGGDVCYGTPVTNFLLSVILLATWPVRFFRSLSVQNELQIYIYNFLAIILPIIQTFVLGALLGWFYGKIKNRNKVSQIS